jgi:hypothetical protein
MTDDMIALQALLAKQPDADIDAPGDTPAKQRRQAGCISPLLSS